MIDLALPDLSIVIPSSKSRDSLNRLLESIKLQNLSCLNIEVVVIGATYKIRNLDLGQLRIKMIHHNSRSANQLRNAGGRQSHSQLLFFVDDDCIFTDRDLILKWWTWFHENRDFDAAGGTYATAKSATYWDQSYNRIIDSWQSSGGGLVGGHLLIRKNLFKDIPFDESLRYGGTESVWLSELNNKNIQWKLMPQFKVLHQPDCHFVGFINKAYRQGKARHLHLQRADILTVLERLKNQPTDQKLHGFAGHALFAPFSWLGRASNFISQNF